MATGEVVHVTSTEERIAYHAERYGLFVREGKRSQAIREGKRLMLLVKRQLMELQQTSIEDVLKGRI